MEYPKKWSYFTEYFDDVLGPPASYICRSLFSAIIGSTRIIESEEFQPDTSRFYAFTDVVPDTLAQGFILSPTNPYRFFITSFSRVSMSDAVEQYEAAHALCSKGSDPILEEQAKAWSRLWHTGGVCLLPAPSPGDNPTEKCSPHNRLPLIINASQYSLLTCLPTHLSGWIDHCGFFGLCPTGLARGNEEDDYLGHVFWDMEIWMLPWINLFHPTQCRLALDYRYFMLPAARYLAVLDDLEGARYPWESAFTGVETTPWKLAADNQIHNVGAVSFSVQQWLLSNLPDSNCFDHLSAGSNDSAASSDSVDSQTSGSESDKRWFVERGSILLEDVAQFWNSRMQFSEEKKAFVILDVMPPDEYTHSCRNSAYTNAIASLALAAPATFARRQRQHVKQEYLDWETRASQLWMPRDHTHQLMLEHEDYTLG
ncbi:unnamed protein product [Echinostoma caproni]|uniref:Glyco_hydro_65m domain-containing protein n=1 Tax=Echinostoma caproni TaxID=27848 RepID=A0A183AI37_9TREM|nr:unnamed protein product [Echinostoma caproni]